MKKELQESCTHTVGARRKEAVPGGGANMLLAATREMPESEMGEARMVHLGYILMKINNPLTLYCMQSLHTVPAQWPFIVFALTFSSQLSEKLTIPTA